MTRTERRIAELEATNRERSLTDDETRELVRLTHQKRQCDVRRERYATDPDYRSNVVSRITGWRKARYAADPVFRARILASNKAYRDART